MTALPATLPPTSDPSFLEEGDLGASLLASVRGNASQQSASNFAPAAYAWLSHFGTSALFGLLSAIALKFLGPPIAFALFIAFVLLLVLAWYGLINLNIGGVVSGLTTNIDLEQVGSVGRRLWSFMVGFGVTAVGGFATGFAVGWFVL